MGAVSASEVTVVVPAHVARVRNGLLARALASVWSQTTPPAAVSLAIDTEGQGAAPTRARALAAVQTPWTAFLDSDDEFLPMHLEALTQAAGATGAAYVFSWFEMVGASDPLGHFGLPFNPRTPHHTTMTVLCRTDIAQEVGFVTADQSAVSVSNEDWLFTCEFSRIAVERNLVMTHLAERTWRYHNHGGNTSGLPYRGDAR